MRINHLPGRNRSTVASAVIALTATAGLAGLLAIGSPAPDPVSASSGGKIGYSGNPAQNGVTCARCHSGGTAPTVHFSGPDRVLAGSTTMFTLTIAGGQRAGGGLGVSANGGMLRAPLGNDDVQESEGEITHKRPKNADVATGEVLFHFLWSAPDVPGRYGLYGAGNSVDLTGNARGDAVATDTFSIAVGDAGSETPTPTAAEPSPTTPTPGTPTTPPTTPSPGTPTTPAPTTPPPTTPPPTAGPTPPVFETVFADLNNPHGLSTLSVATFLVAEGGTGDPRPGEFTPGNGDGRVLQIGPLATDRKTIVGSLTNAQDPGGGVVGANHAMRLWQPTGGGPTEQVFLVAQAGGPGHARPADAARILRIAGDGTKTVLADTLAFEQANNPGGETGPGGIDSNPWRLMPLNERVLIADAGANDVLSMDPATGALKLWAVFAPIGDSEAIPTGMARIRDVVYVALLGPMLTDAPESQVRRLEDENGDGDALDEGENTLLIDGVISPTDLAVGPFGHLYILEMLPGTLSRLDPACWSDGAPCPPAAKQEMASGLTAATALTWDDNFDALVTTGPDVAGGPALRTDRVVRVPFTVLNPTPTPPATETPPATLTPPATGTSPATEPTPAAETATATPAPTQPMAGGTVYLPLVMDRFDRP